MRRSLLLLTAASLLGCRGRSLEPVPRAAAGPCRSRAEALARVRKPSWFDPRSALGAWPPATGGAADVCRFDELDVDGDQRAEVELSCATGHAEHGSVLYRVQGDGCFVELGAWAGKNWQPLASKHDGWPDVEVESAPSHSAGKRLYTVWSYRFDGKRYRLTKTEEHVEDEP
jgi:hypothetical protein